MTAMVASAEAENFSSETPSGSGAVNVLMQVEHRNMVLSNLVASMIGPPSSRMERAGRFVS